MATLEVFQDYKDVCDDLVDICKKVTNGRDVFMQMANGYRKCAELFEGYYWKVSEKDVKNMTEYVKLAYANVEKIIELEESK